jgi:hypothetical protein
MLHLSTFLGALLYVAATLLIYYALGYVALNRIIKTKLRSYGTFISLPVYLATGVVLLTFILYPIGELIFNSLIVYIVAIVVLVCFLRDVLLSVRRRSVPKEENALDKSAEANRRKPIDAIAGIVFAVSLIYVAIILAIAMWPPPGDLINHGFYTSLIIYDQKIPATFSPFRDSPLLYPLGYHINAAFLALCLGIYPGESVFLLGGVLMIMLMSLVFTLTYLMTRSAMLSVLSYMMLYLVNTSGTLETWVFGYLFNGTYPNIYGFMVILFSVTAMVFYAETKDQSIPLRVFPLLMVALLLTYPSFIFVPLILLVLAAIQTGITKLLRQCVGTWRYALTTVFLLMSLIWASYTVYVRVFGGTVQSGGIISAWYQAQQSYLFDNLFGFSMMLALVLSAFLIIFSLSKANSRSLSQPGLTEFSELRPVVITYVLTDLALLLSLSPYLFVLLQYFLPNRLTVLVMILSIVVNIYGLSRVVDIIIGKMRSFAAKKNLSPTKFKALGDLTNDLWHIVVLLILISIVYQILGWLIYVPAYLSMWIVLVPLILLGLYAVKKLLDIIAIVKPSSYVAKRKLRTSNARTNRRNLLVGLTIFLFFNTSGVAVYSLASHASLSLSSGYSWYTIAPAFADDFKALEWINNNVNSSKLILNDFSWSSLFLMSLSIKNVSMNYVYRGFERAEELQTIWLNPDNETLVHSLVEKYNVSYILVTSARQFYDYLGDSTYKSKPYLPSQYFMIFCTYGFLEPVFVSGGSAVFKVK